MKYQIPQPTRIAIQIAKIQQPIRLGKSEVSNTYKPLWKSALTVKMRGPSPRYVW